MIASAAEGLPGVAPPAGAMQAAGVGPDGFLHPLALDAGGNLLVANPAEAAKLAQIAALLSGSLATTSEMGAAVRLGGGFTASTAGTVVAAVGGVLPTGPVPVALLQVPASATKSAVLDRRRLFSNVAGIFTLTRDPTVAATGTGAVAPLNRLAGSAATPQAALYQGGGSTGLAATGGKPEATVVVGSNGTLAEDLGGGIVLPPGHALLVSFLPYALLSYALVAGAGFDWREV